MTQRSLFGPSVLRGMTTIEVMIVMSLAGIVMSVAITRAQSLNQGVSVRSARVEVATLTAIARESAIARGCRTVLHVTSGPAGAAWVTACKPGIAGAVGPSVDTVGVVFAVAAENNVTMTSTRDSVMFDPRGLTVGYLPATVSFTYGTTARDSLVINELGKVVRE